MKRANCKSSRSRLILTLFCRLVETKLRKVVGSGGIDKTSLRGEVEAEGLLLEVGGSVVEY